jgi:hypothetical protein
MAFPGFPDPFPYSRKIWLFKERMAKTEKNIVVWTKLERSWMLGVYRLGLVKISILSTVER